jgi:hypothetical protein
METGSGIWLSLSRKAPPSTSFMVLSSMRPDGGGLRGLGRRRLEVAFGFPYLAKLLSPTSFMHPPSCAHLSCGPAILQHLGGWGLEVASGFPYLAKLLHLTSFIRPGSRAPKRGLGRWRLEVASGFPYLANLLSPPAFRRPSSCRALVDGDWKRHLAFPI